MGFRALQDVGTLVGLLKLLSHKLEGPRELHTGNTLVGLQELNWMQESRRPEGSWDTLYKGHLGRTAGTEVSCHGPLGSRVSANNILVGMLELKQSQAGGS